MEEVMDMGNIAQRCEKVAVGKGLGPVAVAVGACIAAHAADTGRCDGLTVRAIAEWIGSTGETVTVAVRTLEAAGRITVTRPAGRRRCVYQIGVRVSDTPCAGEPNTGVRVSRTPAGGGALSTRACELKTTTAD